MRFAAGRPKGNALLLAVALLAAGCGALTVTPAAAQTITDQLAAQAPTGGDAEMAVRAENMEYDTSGEIVTLTGDVQIYYAGRTLQADKVVYNRKTSRVRATGNVQLKSAAGDITYADTIDITDDFSDGFVSSLRIVTPDRTRFAADRAERSGGSVTVLDKGVYTACEPCKDNPAKPPLWQIKAEKITHDDARKMVYFEGARIEFLGVPLAYVPFLSAPDPSVSRKTGFLAPSYYATTEVGFGIEVPYFIALAPDYDLTITPGFNTGQGPTLGAEWRHRLISGSYNIRAVGVFQSNPNVFPPAPNGPASRNFRGAVQSAGEFWLSERWAWGWDINAFSDRFFRDDYPIARIPGSEAISRLYLRGEGTRSWFEGSFYHFYGLSSADDQDKLPVIHPVVDYDYVVDRPVLGGELGWNVNMTSLTRTEADFHAITAGAICDGLTPGTASRLNCLQRGVDGSYTRLSANLYWKRTFTDPLGQLWTPFAYLRGDIAWSSLDSATPHQFVGQDNVYSARLMPAVGLEYRYPLVAEGALGSAVIEPIAQVIVRPRVTQVGTLPNEDSQSLVFDDTNLFAWDKFSGWDRLEDGSRLNYGVQATFLAANGGSYNVMIGQSLALDRLNPYDGGDMANTGLDSGLDTTRSDIVARATLQPIPGLAVISSGRFDTNDFSMKRGELSVTGALGRLSGNVTYGYFAAQPRLGLGERSAVSHSLSLQLTDNWSASSHMLYDLDRSTLSNIGAGIAYRDECTTFGVNFTRSYSSSGNRDPVDTLMLNLQLRTIGGSTVSRTLTPAVE